MKILLIQLRQLGDILLTTPVTRELKRVFPGCQITFLTHRMGKLILDGNPYIDRHLTYDDNQGIGDWLGLIRDLRCSQFEVVIDFMRNPRSVLFSFLTGAPRRITFAGRRQVFFTDVVSLEGSQSYIVEEKFKLLNPLYARGEDCSLILPWSQSDYESLFNNLRNNLPQFVGAKIRVCFSPTHRRPVRQWPASYYAQIADQLVSLWGATIVWIWGPGEEDFVRECQKLCTETTYMSPKTSFRELAALLANSDFFLGNSNGPSHVAVAVDTPSLQIHGPTKARSWCPLNEKHRAVEAEGSGDSIGSVSVRTVWQATSNMRGVIDRASQNRRKNPKTHWIAKEKEIDC